MDRYDADQRVTIDELISSAERGVEVELTRDGKVMARVISEGEHTPAVSDMAALEALHASLPIEVFDVAWQPILREVREGRSG